MNPSPSDSLETIQWRQSELERVRVGVDEDVRLFRTAGNDWGRMLVNFFESILETDSL